MVTEGVELDGPSCDEERKSDRRPAVIPQECVHKSKAHESHYGDILMHGIFVVELVWGFDTFILKWFVTSCNTIDKVSVTDVEVVTTTY